MLSRLLSAGALLALGAIFLNAAGTSAKRAAHDSHIFKYRQGQQWGVEETLLARMPDPETGQPLTPTVKSRYRYRVIRSLPGGGALVSAEVLEVQGGPALDELRPVRIEPSPKSDQLLLMTGEGVVYGPYGSTADKKALSKLDSLGAWIERRGSKPWTWSKLPRKLLEVGESERRVMDTETWSISRLHDEAIAGTPCLVYSAVLDASSLSVIETTWLDAAGGIVLKTEVSERKSKDQSASLKQIRSL